MGEDLRPVLGVAGRVSLQLVARRRASCRSDRAAAPATRHRPTLRLGGIALTQWFDGLFHLLLDALQPPGQLPFLVRGELQFGDGLGRQGLNFLAQRPLAQFSRTPGPTPPAAGELGDVAVEAAEAVPPSQLGEELSRAWITASWCLPAARSGLRTSAAGVGRQGFRRPQPKAAVRRRRLGHGGL